MPGQLVVVTGISGTGVMKSLTKYTEWCALPQQGPTDVRLVQLEKRIEPLLQNTRYADIRPSEQKDLWFVLQLPRVEQAGLWGAAFDDAVTEARSAVDAGAQVLFTFHASWYHIRFREFISLVDLDRVKALQPDLFVTLVDDIYDVGARLSGPGQVFEGENFKPALADRVFKLLAILNWRACECLLTDRIATACNKRHYVFAVKHPMATLQALLDTDKPKVYLSHSITNVKDALREGDGEAQRKAEALVGEIEQVSTLLREGNVLFEPTTIDELCIHGKQMEHRWPIGAGLADRLWVEPESNREAWWDLPAVEGEESGILLRALEDEIKKHINARDHRLVDQSDALVVYRPFAGGRYASGIHEEVAYYSDLVRLGIRARPARVLHTPADEAGRMAALTEEALEEVGRTLGRQLTRAEWTLFENQVLPELALGKMARMNPTDIARAVGAALRQAGIDLYDASRRRGALNADPVQTRHRVLAEIGTKVRDLVDSCYLEVAEQAKALVVDRDPLDPAAFVQRFMEQ